MSSCPYRIAQPHLCALPWARIVPHLLKRFMLCLCPTVRPNAPPPYHTRFHLPLWPRRSASKMRPRAGAAGGDGRERRRRERSDRGNGQGAGAGAAGVGCHGV